SIWLTYPICAAHSRERSRSRTMCCVAATDRGAIRSAPRALGQKRWTAMAKVLERRVVVCAAVFLLVAGACSGGDNQPAASSASRAATASSAAPRTDPGQLSAGDPSQAGYTPTGPLVADNGFRPETDGFAFENYGKAPEGQ